MTGRKKCDVCTDRRTDGRTDDGEVIPNRCHLCLQQVTQKSDSVQFSLIISCMFMHLQFYFVSLLIKMAYKMAAKEIHFSSFHLAMPVIFTETQSLNRYFQRFLYTKNTCLTLMFLNLLLAVTKLGVQHRYIRWRPIRP